MDLLGLAALGVLAALPLGEGPQPKFQTPPPAIRALEIAQRDPVNPRTTDRAALAALIEQVRLATVQVTASGVEGAARRVSHGTGTFISPRGFILTCLHVVKDFPKIEVQTHENLALDARLIWSEPRLDLAILRVEASDRHHTLRLGLAEKVQPGQTTVLVGFPTRGQRQWLEGKVVGNTRMVRVPVIEPGTEMLRFDGAITPGFSGGPIVSLEGHLLGVVAAKGTLHPQSGYALPVDRFFLALESRATTNTDARPSVPDSAAAEEAQLVSRLVADLRVDRSNEP